MPASFTPEQIHLIYIQWESFSLVNDQLENEEELVGYGYTVEVEVFYDADEHPDLKGVEIKIRVFGQDENDKELPIQLNAELTFIFQVEGLEELVNSENGKSLHHLEATLTGIAYSTIRGMLMGKTQDTYFKGFVLPVADPYKVLEGEYAE